MTYKNSNTAARTITSFSFRSKTGKNTGNEKLFLAAVFEFGYVITALVFKVENILKGSLDLIPSPSPSVKIQIMGGKVCLRCKGKTLMGSVNKLLKTKSLMTKPSNVLPYYFK